MYSKCGYCWSCERGLMCPLASASMTVRAGTESIRSCYNHCQGGKFQDECSTLVKKLSAEEATKWLALAKGSEEMRGLPTKKSAPVVKVTPRPVQEKPILDQEWDLEFKYKWAKEMEFYSLIRLFMICTTIISALVVLR